MLKNFWWPLEFSVDVTSKPRRITALGQEFVAFRTPDGRPQVMSDLCVHRGGALSDGWLEGDCIICPYHGWKYQPDGECILIPANLQHLTVPKKARVDSYPTVDRYGWTWAFLGDLPAEERPPLPELPYLEDPAYRPVHGRFQWKAHYTRVLENGVDAAHTPFVHGGSFGNPDEPEIEDYKVENFEYSARAVIHLKPTPAKGLWGFLFRSKERRDVVKTVVQWWMPNVSLLEVHLPLGLLIVYNAHVPIDDYTTVSKWFALRTFFKGSWADKNAIDRTLKIFRQDQPVVESQRPELLPYDLGAELHVKSDAIQIAYRRMRQKFIDRGWGIDTHRIQSEFSRHQAVVIPSPTRREVPELARAWIMKEVPTKPARNGAVNGKVQPVEVEE